MKLNDKKTLLRNDVGPPNNATFYLNYYLFYCMRIYDIDDIFT